MTRKNTGKPKLAMSRAKFQALSAQGLLKTADIVRELIRPGGDKARTIARVRNFATAGYLVPAGRDPRDRRGAYLYRRDQVLVAAVLGALADLGLDLKASDIQDGVGSVVATALQQPSGEKFPADPEATTAAALVRVWARGETGWTLIVVWQDGATGPTPSRCEVVRLLLDDPGAARPATELRLNLDRILAALEAGQ